MNYNKTSDKKARLEEINESDLYQEARDKQFSEEFLDFAASTIMMNLQITEDDIGGFMESFTFEDKEQWCLNYMDNEIGAEEDRRYEESRDEDIK